MTSAFVFVPAIFAWVPYLLQLDTVEILKVA